MEKNHKGEENWLKIRSEDFADLKLFKARFDFMRNPRNGHTEKMIVLESPDSVNVVAKTSDGFILFVEQYRFGLGINTLELPGGIVDKGEDHGVAAKRELVEETGFESQSWTFLTSAGANPVFMTAYIHHWWADKIEETQIQRLDEGEAIKVVKIKEEEVLAKLTSGFFIHPHTTSALVAYFASTGRFFSK